MLTMLLNIDDVVISDQKSEVAMKCLIALLPAPPKRGVKGPKVSPSRCIDHFFQQFEVRIGTKISIVCNVFGKFTSTRSAEA